MVRIMTYIKNPTENQKKEWREQAKIKEREARDRITEIARSFREDPESIQRFLTFSSNFYRYSPRNNMLIYSQNPFATFVQSFKGWKDDGYSVKKGEQGLDVLVPVKTTLLKVSDNDYVSLRDASEEQKALYKAGKIESFTKLSFKIGTVFDISQTTFPKEKYPDLFHRGYDSSIHKNIAESLIEYCKSELGCPVSINNLHSISLNGYYRPDTHDITLNSNLKDTHLLSTLTHEMGHALAYHKNEKPDCQQEYEGDCFSILIHQHFGLDLQEGRVRHLSTHFRNFESMLQKKYKDLDPDAANKEIDKEIENSFASVFSKFSDEIDKMDLSVKRNCPDLFSEIKSGRSEISNKYFEKYANKSRAFPAPTLGIEK